MRHFSYAFTLVELLAVIAIIGVLAAILIPVAGSVRKMAARTQCVSNLRQLGMIWQQELADTRGDFVPLESGHELDPKADSWIGYTEQMDNKRYAKITQCPAQWKRKHSLFPDSTRFRWNTRTYSFNRDTNRRRNVNADSYWKPCYEPVEPSAGGTRRTFSEFSPPSRVAIFADGYTRDEDDFYSGVWGSGKPPEFIHDGSANVCFMDGHVANMKENDPIMAAIKHGYPEYWPVGSPASIFLFGE